MDYKRKSVDEMTDEERSKIKRTNLASCFKEQARKKEEVEAKAKDKPDDSDVKEIQAKTAVAETAVSEEEANLNTSEEEQDGEEKDDKKQELSKPLSPTLPAAIIEEWSYDADDASLLKPRINQDQIEADAGVKRQSWREENDVVLIDSEDTDSTSGDS